MGCLYILLMVSFAVQELLSLTESHLFILFFSFVSLAWGDTSHKKLLRAMSEILLPMFSSRIFVVSGLTFKSLIYFEFILVWGVTRWPSFIFLHVSVWFSQHHLKSKLSLVYGMCLLPLLNIDCKGAGYFWTLNSVPLLCGTVFMPVPCCFDYYGLIL